MKIRKKLMNQVLYNFLAQIYPPITFIIIDATFDHLYF